jgi:hypothetical protein
MAALVLRDREEAQGGERIEGVGVGYSSRVRADAGAAFFVRDSRTFWGSTGGRHLSLYSNLLKENNSEPTTPTRNLLPT